MTYFVSGPSDSSHLLDIFDSMRDLRDWKKLGLYLGVPYPTLDTIEVSEILSGLVTFPGH